MRRRTTILDVLREEQKRARTEADLRAELGDSRTQGELERQGRSSDLSSENPSRAAADVPESDSRESRSRARRRRRERADWSSREQRGEKQRGEKQRGENDLRQDHSTSQRSAASAHAQQDAQATGSEDAVARARRTAARRRSGLVAAEWLQGQFSVTRGWSIAAALLLCFGIWGVFALGRMTGRRAEVARQELAQSGAALEQPRPMRSGRRPLAVAEGQRQIRPAGNEPGGSELRAEGASKSGSESGRDQIGGFAIASYAPIPKNRALIASFVHYLEEHLRDLGAEPGSYRRTGAGGEETWLVAVKLPQNAIGDARATDAFFERLRKLPAPDPKLLRFDFKALERFPIPLSRL